MESSFPSRNLRYAGDDVTSVNMDSLRRVCDIARVLLTGKPKRRDSVCAIICRLLSVTKKPCRDFPPNHCLAFEVNLQRHFSILFESGYSGNPSNENFFGNKAN